MGARPLRRAIQRYIEDPLADFVLRAELVPGATVMVEPAAEGDEQEMILSIVKPPEKPAPVAVGGRERGRRGGRRASTTAARSTSPRSSRPTRTPSRRRASASPKGALRGALRRSGRR